MKLRVDDVAENPAQIVVLVRDRRRFKLWDAPAALSVQFQNANNSCF